MFRIPLFLQFIILFEHVFFTGYNNFFRSRGDSPSSSQHPVSSFQAVCVPCRRHPWRLFLPFGRRGLRFESPVPLYCVEFCFAKLLRKNLQSKFFRSRGDSNPRYPLGAQLLSREPPSASRSPLLSVFYIKYRTLKIADFGNKIYPIFQMFETALRHLL